ncbi:aldo/keto reductase [Cysteiniphilum halobium]|uniref:aldo/keto reductase n=1 Tax=Cysteiniphilum halobium TaxID=2219059 RepID=UPI003F85ECAD
MKKRQIGTTDIRVTELGLGGAPLGNLYQKISNLQANETIKMAWQSDIHYFDTAPQYGSGLSEHRLGYFLQEQQQDKFVLSTKVGKILRPTSGIAQAYEDWFINPLPFQVIYDYSYDGFQRSIEDSLQRLGLNHIDIVHIHDLDHLVLKDTFHRYFKQAMESGYPLLAKLKKQGMIGAISMGVKQWEVCQDALKYGDFDCFMLQDSYTLLDHNALEFLNQCAKKGISVLVAGAFSSGILVEGSANKNAKYQYNLASNEIIQRVKALEKICQQFNVPLPAAALQFPLRHPAIASVVAGMNTSEQVMQNKLWLNTKIPEALWQEMKRSNLIPE